MATSVAEVGVQRSDLHQVYFRQAAARLAAQLGRDEIPRALLLDGTGTLTPEAQQAQDTADIIIRSVFQLNDDQVGSRKTMSGGSLHFEGTTVQLIRLADGPGIILKIGEAADREVQTHMLALQSDEMGAHVLPLIGSRDLSFMATPFLGEDSITVREALTQGKFASEAEVHSQQDEIVEAFTSWAAKNLVAISDLPVVSMQRIEWGDQTRPALAASVAFLEQRMGIEKGRLWDAELVIQTRTRRGRVREEVFPSIGQMEAEITPSLDPSNPSSRPKIMAAGIDYDQSPKNWFITPYGLIKIDFGYAALQTEVTDVAEALAIALKGISLATATHIGNIRAHFEEGGTNGKGRLVVEEMDVTIAQQAREWQHHGIARLSYYARKLKQKMGVVSDEFWLRFATNALHEVAYVRDRVPQQPEAAIFMWREAGRAFKERDKARKRYQPRRSSSTAA